MIGFTMLTAYIFTNNHLYYHAVKAWSAPFIHPADSNKVYEFGIVLGGSTDYNPELQQIDYNARADRMTEAIRLYRLGRIKKLVLTGDPAFNIIKGRTSAPFFLQYMKEMGINPKHIILEQHARTTRENAINLQTLLHNQNKGSPCLLITSGWHMRRALKDFSHTGLNLIPYAVDMPHEETDENWMEKLPSWKAALAWQELLHEMIGRFIE